MEDPGETPPHVYVAAAFIVTSGALFAIGLVMVAAEFPVPCAIAAFPVLFLLSVLTIARHLDNRG